MAAKYTVSLAFLITTLSACTSPFEGTWLLQYDVGSLAYDSSCSADESTVTYIGDDYQWVDIYKTTGGALVFTDGEYDLVGAASGQSFEVSGTYGQMLGSSYYEWELTIAADLSGKDLSGDSDLKEITGDADSECRSQSKVSFEGVKMRGWDRPARTIGTQSSQTATSNE